MHVCTECQSAQGARGARTKHGGLSHRELMTDTRADVRSDALKDIMQRLATLNTTPAVLESRQDEEEGEEPEEELGSASSLAAWQPEQSWWQGWQG